jgi:hypothetical protein
LLAGLALPAMAGVVNGGTAGNVASAKPQRFEDTVGFEVADLISRSGLAILPLGSGDPLEIQFALKLYF